MPVQVVPSTDKSYQEEFPEAFFESALRNSVKISKKVKLVDSNTNKIISQAFPNYLF